MNLLKETKEDIAASGHKPTDIVFIGSAESGHCCTWEEFEVLADNDYNCGCGAQEVATDLVIVFKDGTNMWREEYDGSEGWSYSAPIKIPEKTYTIKSLFVTPEQVGWETLGEINKE